MELNNTKYLVALEKAISFLGGGSFPLKSFFKSLRYNDEPLLYGYNFYYGFRGELDWSGGSSFNKNKAKMKAAGEAIERYCLGIYDSKNFYYSSKKDLRGDSLKLEVLVNFSSEQKLNKKFSDFIYSKDSKFNWIKGKNLISNKTTFIPAQLIYVPYKFINEPILRLPITTGAAAGTTLEESLYRGICEAVERDSFIIFYLAKLGAVEVDLAGSSEHLKNLHDYFEQYKLELRVFDITSNIGIPVFMAVIIDETNIGPRTSIGLKCSLLREDAIIGAIEEAAHTRPWMRDEKVNFSSERLSYLLKNPESISDMTERGMFWYSQNPYEKLDFWLSSSIKKKKRIVIGDNKKKSDNAFLFQEVKKKLEKMNYDIYYVDVTVEEVKKSGFTVVKVIIPQLQPLFLDEQYKYYGGDRLKKELKGKKLNIFPHPFL